MLTTRMRPKISVNPLATTKYSAAAVSPLSSVIRKSLGSLTAEPKLVPDAMNRTQTMRNATTAVTSPYASSLAGRAVPRRAIGWRNVTECGGCCKRLSRIISRPWPGVQLRHGFDLETRAGDREAADLDQRAGRPGGAEERFSERVDPRAVVDVEQVDGDLRDVAGRAAGRREHAAHEREDLPRLRDHVLADEDAVLVDRDDPRDVQRVAGEDGVGVVADRLGQPRDVELAAAHPAAARISASVWRGVIASGSTRSSISAGPSAASAASNASANSSERSTSAPWAPNARA